MFKINREEIGNYISKRISDNSTKFKSDRDFCREWLKLNNEEINPDNIQNKANKLSQIKKGTKGIQIDDLPAFSELLGVSFEQILSAGNSGKANEKRMTNYYIAQSHSQQEWQEYIDREDKPILCKDEFGINIIEYAIQFQNYDFLKFLTEKGYIWFDSQKDEDYVTTFGAGTSILKINFEDRGNGIFVRTPDMNDMEYKLATEDQLRMYMIALACDNGDPDMLEKLRAREIPGLYYMAHYLSCSHPDINASYNEAAKSAVKRIAKSRHKEILEYFTDSFEVRDHVKYNDSSKRKHIFVYPFISQLLDYLISYNSRFTDMALKKMIEYNNSVYDKLKKLIKNSTENGCYTGDSWKKELNFYKNGNIVSFRDTYAVTGIITNIANATKTSKNPETNKLIDELHKTYNQIRHLGR